MSEEKPAEGVATPENEPPASTQAPTAISPVSNSQDRTELLSRARNFLLSPQIIHQDTSAKRKFLADKGLDESEINGILQGLPVQRPAIPPRTYPQLPPSNLPTLFLGLARIFSWIAGGSAALIFIYYRILLPRITRTTVARQSIRSHHLSLLRRLTTSMGSLKESQAESYAALPRPDPYRETSQFNACHSIVDVLTALGDKKPDTDNLPPISLIRCGIEEYGKGKAGDQTKPTTEELFQLLEDRVPWLVSEEGLVYEQKLWETLSTCPLFAEASLPTPADVSDNHGDHKPTRWTYTALSPKEPSPVLKSLTALADSLPKKTTSTPSSKQHTLQALSDFTGYISTQVYMPYRAPMSAMGFHNMGNTLGPAEEEFKREIRALKGLVLNRRSFMPSIPRAGAPPPVSTP